MIGDKPWPTPLRSVDCHPADPNSSRDPQVANPLLTWDWGPHEASHCGIRIDVRWSEKAPRTLRGASDLILWHTCGAGVWLVWPKTPPRAQIRRGHFIN